MTAILLKHLQDSLNRDALAFMPELVLCGAIVLMLLLRLFPRFDNKHLGWVALILVGYAFAISCQQWKWKDPSWDPRVRSYQAGEPIGHLEVLDVENQVLKVKSMNIFSGMLVF